MKKQFTHRELADLCRELALMIHAGIGSAEALSLLRDEETSPRLKPILTAMAELTDNGAPLSDAVRDAGCFPAYMVGLVNMGERTGNLEEALNSLADYYDERERMNQRIRSALLYPSVLFLLMMVVIVVLLTKVLPMFRSVYASLGGEMTGVAGVLLGIGLGMDRILPVLCVLFALLLAVVLAISLSGSFREWLLRRWRSFAGDKGVMRSMNDACLAQAISMGLSSGLPAEDALELAANVLSDIPSAQKRCMDCKAALEQGESLVEALRIADIFPPAARRLLGLAVQSGSGDTTMREIAGRLSEDADLALSKKVSRIEPALVLICSVLVGAVLLSVMLPLIDIMEMIG